MEHSSQHPASKPTLSARREDSTMHGPGDILPRSAAMFGHKTALITSTRTLSYSELDLLSDRLAARLIELGVSAGDRVTIYSQNRWEWIVSYHGILKAGAVVNPVNAMLTADELSYVMRDCGVRAVLTGVEQASAVQEVCRDLPQPILVVAYGAAPGTVNFTALIEHDTAPPPAHMVRAADACSIGYTSGTTGRPKGAVQSHEAVLLNCAHTAAMHGRTSDDVVVTGLPAAHVYGNVAINSTFMACGTVVLMDRFDAGQALELIERHEATLFEGVPTMYSLMLADPTVDDVQLTSLRASTVGGQTIAPATVARWEERSGAPMIELWGMTELSGLGATHSLHAPKVSGSVGISLPGVDLRVVDLDDPSREITRGEPGELMVRGPITMLGYHNDPDATAEVFTDDGWLHSGDVAVMTPSGHVVIVDRKKDLIITAGYNVYPAELERVLAAHPGVAMVAVGPVADPMKGELACAYVVRRPGDSVTEEELIAYTADRLAAYKRPRLVRFVDSLPTTSTGKIVRRNLSSSADQSP